MTIPRLFLLPALLLSLVLAGCGGDGDGSADEVPADAVAVVGGDEIPKSEFESLITQAKTSYKNQSRAFPAAGSEEFQALRNQIVQALIQRVELKQAAEEMDIEVSDEDVDKRLDRIKKQNFGGDQAKLEKQLKEQNLTIEQVRRDLGDQVLSEKIYKRVTKDVEVTDAKVNAFYAQNKTARYSQPESRDVRHILVKGKAKAQQVRGELAPGGANFAALARKYTQDTGSKATGGKLTISRGQTVAPFDKVAFGLEQNEISGLVKTQFGFHIIQAQSPIKKAKITPLKEVAPAIRQELLQTEKQKVITKWVEGLKKRYEDKVSYAVGFNPPAAATATTSGTTTSEQ